MNNTRGSMSEAMPQKAWCEVLFEEHVLCHSVHFSWQPSSRSMRRGLSGTFGRMVLHPTQFTRIYLASATNPQDLHLLRASWVIHLTIIGLSCVPRSVT